jgi:hypothetical protein
LKKSRSLGFARDDGGFSETANARDDSGFSETANARGDGDAEVFGFSARILR